MADASIAGMFRAVLPADRVSEDTATRRLAASDIAFEAASLPACVLTPRSEAEVACDRPVLRAPKAWRFTRAAAAGPTRQATRRNRRAVRSST